MLIQFSLSGQNYAANIANAIDISIPLDFNGAQPSAFHIPRATAWCFESAGFVGDTRRGSSCNCMTLMMTPHGNGTHTECVGHISNERHTVPQLMKPAFLPATLISVTPAAASTLDEDERFPDGQDSVIGWRALSTALQALGPTSVEFRRALVVRTLPNSSAKWSTSYSGTNPPYFSHAAMRLIREWGTEHLLCDLPSVERESDGGTLTAHHIFFAPSMGGYASTPVNTQTITEMIYVDESVRDGVYLLDLQFPPFLLEAVPSRPVLFPVAIAASSAYV